MKDTVCLVIPPSPFLLDERVFVSLGILKVAASLEAQGYAVELVDLSGVANYEEAMRTHAYHSKAYNFGITATTPQLPAACRIAKAIREGRGQSRIILGGPHPTLTLAAVKKKSARAERAMEKLREVFDVIVAGDGEDSIGQAIVAKPGTLIDADDPKGPLFLTSKRLNETPWPARHLLDLDSYHYSVDGVRAHTAIFQLGCPFGCTFCGGRSSPMLRKIRMRSTENILAEIEHLYTAYGFRGLMAYDDELNVNPKMVELMRGITALAKKLGTEFRLRGFVKAELFTQEQADVMYEAGFRWLLTGFESGSPRILENIQKKATVADNDRCVAFARNAGLKVKALMSIGHAGESATTIKETQDWLLKTRPDDFDCTIITPYPGSPYYDEAVESEPQIWTYTSPVTGDRLHAYELDYTQTADYYKSKPGDGYRSYVYTDHISANFLVELRDELENTVRAALNIPFNPGAPGIQFEASMGQLPSHILRRSA